MPVFDEIRSGAAEAGSPRLAYGVLSDAQKAALAGKAMRALRSAFFLAKEMGEIVGRGEVLLRALPTRVQACRFAARFWPHLVISGMSGDQRSARVDDRRKWRMWRMWRKRRQWHKWSQWNQWSKWSR